jgi:hypothetical protein
MLLAIFLVSLVIPLVLRGRLRFWQRRYAEERLLLWLVRLKTAERAAQLSLIATLQEQVTGQQADITRLTQQVNDAAAALNKQADQLAREYASSAILTRDVYIAGNKIWNGQDPDELYFQVRPQLVPDEPAVIAAFLRYVQAHVGDVVQALHSGTIGSTALDFMRANIQTGATTDPFSQWPPQIAEQALDRAIQSARVPLQPRLAGRPLGRFDALAARPSIPWLARLAEERQLEQLPLVAKTWCLVVRVMTRAQHPLVVGKRG